MADKTIRMGFDPLEKFGEMWRDNEARIFWLLWRPGHLVPNGFESSCVAIANRIRAVKPTTADELSQCFPVMSQTFTPYDVKTFAPEALPYFTGEKSIDWEVVQK